MSASPLRQSSEPYAFERHVEDDVRRRQGLLRVGAHHRVERGAHQAEHRRADGLLIAEVAHVHRDDMARAHGADDVGRDVVHRAAIDQHLVVHLDRRKDARQRHGGAHRGRQQAAIDHDGLRRLEVHGHHAERRRQRVERRRVEVGRRDARDQQVHLLAVVERRRQHQALLEPELQPRRVRPGVGLAPDVLERVRGRPEHFVPVDRPEHRLDLVRAHATGEGAADEAAHAGARRDVDRDVVFLEPPNHADVRDAARAAAPEGDADLGALLRVDGKRASRRRAEVRGVRASTG